MIKTGDKDTRTSGPARHLVTSHKSDLIINISIPIPIRLHNNYMIIYDYYWKHSYEIQLLKADGNKEITIDFNGCARFFNSSLLCNSLFFFCPAFPLSSATSILRIIVARRANNSRDTHETIVVKLF